jgi:hypothetical protein
MIHLKKRLATFPSPAGMSLTKLSLDGNIANLFFTVYRKLALHIICLPIVEEDWRGWLEYSTETVWEKYVIYGENYSAQLPELKNVHKHNMLW